jgi:cell division GTPase FtsZ
MNNKKYMFIGLGQTGNNLVSCLTEYKNLIADPSKQAYYINFSATDLASDFKGKTLLIDVGGTGKSPERGTEFVNANSHKITEFLRRHFGQLDADTEFVILTSLGGGTGASLTPFVLDYLNNSFPALKKSVVGVKSSIKEGATTTPNMLKTYQKLFNNYVRTGNLGAFLIFDNDYFEKEYEISGSNWNGLNTHICSNLSKILDDSFSKQSSEGFGSLDYNEKKKAQYFGKGLADFSSKQVNIGDEYEYKSTIFDGKYSNKTSKYATALFKFRKKPSGLSEKDIAYADKLNDYLKNYFKSGGIVVGYNFGNTDVEKDIEILVWSNGLDKPDRFLKSTEKKAIKSVEGIKKSHEEYDSDLSGLNF